MQGWGVGLVKSRRIPFIENRKTFVVSELLGFLVVPVVWFLGFVAS